MSNTIIEWTRGVSKKTQKPYTSLVMQQLGKYPISHNAEQWNEILKHADEIRSALQRGPNEDDLRSNEIARMTGPTMEQKAIADAKASADRASNPIDNLQVGKMYKFGTFTNFVDWMQSVYNVDAVQARAWSTDTEYQKEFQAYLESHKEIARPQKRAQSIDRPAKRMTPSEIAEKSAEMKEREKSKSNFTSAKRVNYAILVDAKIVNGKLHESFRKMQSASKRAVQRDIPVGTILKRANIKNGELQIETREWTEADRDAQGSHKYDAMLQQRFIKEIDA